MIRLIWAELDTPTGQTGPLSAAYARAAGGVWHAVLGAALVATLGLGFGMATGFALALVYWLAKERGDLRRGGRWWDGAEDAVMVSLGAWYGAAWWPVLICGAGLYVMVARGRRYDAD